MAQKQIPSDGCDATGRYTVEQLLGGSEDMWCGARTSRSMTARKTAGKRAQKCRYRRFLKFQTTLSVGDCEEFAATYFCIIDPPPALCRRQTYCAQAAKGGGLECDVTLVAEIGPRSVSHAPQDHWLSQQVFDWSGITAAIFAPRTMHEWLSILHRVIRRSDARPMRHRSTRLLRRRTRARVIVGSAKPEEASRQVYPLYGPS